MRHINLTPRYGKIDAKLMSSEITLQNPPKMKIRAATKCSSARHIADASAHDKGEGIGLNASDLRGTSSTSWCGCNLVGQGLERTR